MDSAAAIVTAIQAAASDLGLPAPDAQRARHVIGLGLGDALRHAIPELLPERYPQLADRYRHHYLARDHELTLFAGVEAMLGELLDAGVHLAVATGKSRVGLERALRSSGIGACFEATRCADECFSKPHPQMLYELMAEVGVSAGRTLMIGDTTHDLNMANNAAVAALAVAYGAHPRALLEDAAPVAVFDTVPELHHWLLTQG
jgi:phosphoglycolate phosphatase